VYCIVCSHDVVDCECRDIEQRLASLCRPECGVAPAAAANLEARTLKKLLAGKPPN
jgi:hypothetical protein